MLNYFGPPLHTPPGVLLPIMCSYRRYTDSHVTELQAQIGSITDATRTNLQQMVQQIHIFPSTCFPVITWVSDDVLYCNP